MRDGEGREEGWAAEQGWLFLYLLERKFENSKFEPGPPKHYRGIFVKGGQNGF